MFDTLQKKPIDDGGMNSSTATPPDHPAKLSQSENLPNIIERMRSQMRDVEVLMSCHREIEQFSCRQLSKVEPSLRRRLVEVSLSVLTQPCQDNCIVEKFSNLLVDKIAIDEGETDWYLGAIDCLLEIICDENKLTTMARKSTFKLLRDISKESDVNQRNLVGEKSMKKNVRLIRIRLDKSEYDEIMEISWNCLKWICVNSIANKKRFLDTGGISLFQQCYKMFNNQTMLIYSMTGLIEILSEEKSIRQDLMADENLAILWEIWRESKFCGSRSYCFYVFSNFLSDSSLKWSSVHPTIEEVEKMLKDWKE